MTVAKCSERRHGNIIRYILTPILTVHLSPRELEHQERVRGRPPQRAFDLNFSG